LAEWGLDVPEFEKAPADGLTDPDEVPEAPAYPVSVLGDLWILGNHRVLCGDSTNSTAWDRLIVDAEQAAIVWTDPPYGVAYTGKTKDALTIENDALDESGLASLLQASLGLAYTHCRDGAVWYVAAPAGPLHLVFASVLRDLDVWRQTIQWVKDRFVMGRSDYHYRNEPIFYGWKPGAAHYFVDDRTQDTVWEIARPSANREHPTMKPVELVERALKNSSKVSDVVLEPFGGSGTTLLAAERTQRIARLIELTPSIALRVRRLTQWRQATEEQPMANPRGNPQNLKPFPKGKSGNPKGRPKLPDISEALAKILADEKDGTSALEATLMALRAKAVKGDIRAAEALLDRAFGKPRQSVDHTTGGDKLVPNTIKVELIAPSADE